MKREMEESEKISFRLNIKKKKTNPKITPSSPITECKEKEKRWK